MANLILKEIEQDNFSIDNLIETLTYKSTEGRVGQANFDPLVLEDIFRKTIDDLKKINEKSKQKIETLESECQKEKQTCKEKIEHLESQYKAAYERLAELDKRISGVSSQMSEMGTQLDNLNKPRLNLFESHKIAKYFDKFMDGIENSGVFADDSKLDQAAEIIYKLHLLSIDLGDEDEKFANALVLIDKKYNEVEEKLIERFHKAFYKGDTKLMKKYIMLLSNFKRYPNCKSDFIKNCQFVINSETKDVFAEIMPLCRRTSDIIGEVFNSNEKVMEQFVKDLFLGKFQNFVNTNLEKYKDTDIEKYLDTIHIYYNKNKKIFNELAELMKIPVESTFFTKLMNDVYSSHLRDYPVLEKQNLMNKLRIQLERFWESIGHVKQNAQGLFQNFLSSKSTNEIIDDRFLSHDVTTLCIDDSKKSLNRIQLLADMNQQPKLFEEIFDIICNYLCKDHFIYAIDLQIQSIKTIDVKQELNLHIFPLIKQLNNLIYLFEQFTNASVLQVVNSTPYHSKIFNRQKQIFQELESKIDIGLEKAFTTICNHLKHVLQMEQKRTDFKSETDEISNQCTSACSKTIRIIENQIAKINMCLDGRNVNSGLKELGIKFHRCIYDHIFSFQYNELGAMALIRDINEYRLCAKNFNSQVVDKLFTVLYSLSNLLVVKPTNLNEICAGDNLAMLSKDTIESFVQLRSDYKTLKFNISNRPKQ